MKILISGICGFVGSTLAKVWHEIDSSHTIYGIDNLSRPGVATNRRWLEKLGVHVWHGDLRVASDLECLPHVDYLIDAAANPSVLAGIDGYANSRQLIEHNLLSTVNMLEFCKVRSAGFILLSSSRVYSINAINQLELDVADGAYFVKKSPPPPIGLSPKGVTEMFSTEPPISLYGATKKASETLALEYGQAFDFPVWINRCGLLAGAGQFGRADQGIVAFWINAWRAKRPLKYIGFNGQGYQVRDCFHPSDLIQLIEKQMQTTMSTKPAIVNVSGGIDNSFSLCQLSHWCEERFGQHKVDSDTQENRPYDVPWLVMDHTLAEQEWGWQPVISCYEIFEEVACHAEKNPDWLLISGVQ